MHAALRNPVVYRTFVLGAVMVLRFAISAPAAELMPPARQNALVRKYRAVCHTDAARKRRLVA
jgi:hypothetical protein